MTPEAADKIMYATISLYITSERMEQTFPNWTLKTRRELQRKQATRKLSETIDPLFNDIAIRDRNAAVDEFLVEGSTQDFVITIPATVKWRTEGCDFEANLGRKVTHTSCARTFWYAHSDGAISFHMSMPFSYGHSLSDYYALSILQKLIFPTEAFVQGEHTDGDICSGKTGRWIVDTPIVRLGLAGGETTEGAAGSVPFWTFVRNLTELQLGELAKQAGLQRAVPKPRSLWDALVACDATNFLEVPGLKAPRARAAFLMLDRDLFKLLRPEAREILGTSPAYSLPLLQRSQGKVVIDTAALEALARQRGDAFDLRYYFLAGFFQNIIDFLNQDISELRDGTDAAYPSNEEQQQEALVFRYANKRSLFQVVESLRSLEVGKEHIGTCPYFFLVHLLVLHNEFLVLRYEARIAQLQRELDATTLTRFGNLQSLLKRWRGKWGAGPEWPPTTYSAQRPSSTRSGIPPSRTSSSIATRISCATIPSTTSSSHWSASGASRRA